MEGKKEGGRKGDRKGGREGKKENQINITKQTILSPQLPPAKKKKR
jgi:hypothetical protein